MDYAQFSGFLLALPTSTSVPGAVLLFVALAYTGAPLWLWSVSALAAMVGFAAPQDVVIGGIVVLAFFKIKPRRALLSGLIMKVMKGMLPLIYFLANRISKN
jgi:hypothetical protein